MPSAPASHPWLPPQEVAQRALVSYLRSVFLQPNRKVFDVTQASRLSSQRGGGGGAWHAGGATAGGNAPVA